eukprot:6604617-Prymnesium_polylepis.1
MRLLRSLEPLCASHDARREVEQQCEELATGGSGAAELQAMLEARMETAERGGTSWISEWWR